MGDEAAPGAALVGLSEIRRLWESGERRAALASVLTHWDDVLVQGGDPGWLEGALRTSGLPVEAFAVQARSTRRRDDPPAWESLAGSVLQSGDPWWARALLSETRCASRALDALRVEVDVALGDPSASIAAWLRTYGDAAALEAAVDWCIRSDRAEDAERLLEQAARRSDETEGLTLWRARLAVWRGQPAAARTLLRRLAPSAETRCLEAVATMHDGDLERAESLLRALLDTGVRAEAWSWLATALRKMGRYAEAVRAADAGNIASQEFNLATRLERELSATASNVSTTDRILRAARLQRGGMSRQVDVRTIGELEHAQLLGPLGLRPGDPIRALAAVLDRFGGNHTPHLTTVEDGALRSFALPEDPRHLGARLQLVLWTRGPEAVRALYRELAPSVGGHPLFRIYQGELELWMGGYEDAARIFRDVLARDAHVRWAWIGLGASAMLQGDLRDAQAIWEKGLAVTRFAGPTLYVYRGECYRRQGALDRAREDLTTALREKPQRLSARINLALADGSPAALADAERECVAFAPFLMEGLQGGPAEKLEHVLEAMRGNRSSSPALMSYHLWGRLWRRAQ